MPRHLFGAGMPSLNVKQASFASSALKFLGAAGNVGRKIPVALNTAVRAAPTVAANAVNNPVTRAAVNNPATRLTGNYVKNLAGYGPGGSLEGTTNLLFRNQPYISPQAARLESAAKYVNPFTGSLGTGAGGFVTGSGVDAFNAHVGNKPTNYGAQWGLGGLALGGGLGMLPKSMLSRIPIDPMRAAKNVLNRNVFAPIERAGPAGQALVNSGRLVKNVLFTPKLKPFFDMIPNKTIGSALSNTESAALGGTGAYLAWRAANALPDTVKNQIMNQTTNAYNTALPQIDTLPEYLKNPAMTALNKTYDVAANKAEDARKKTWQAQLQIANPFSNFWQTPATPIPERLQQLGLYAAQEGIDRMPDMKQLPSADWKLRTMPFGPWWANIAANYGIPNVHHGVNAVVDQFRSPEAMQRRQEKRLALQ